MSRVKDEMVLDPLAATVPGTRRALLALFVRHGHAGFPVVKEGAKKLVGLVTRQDIFERPDESQVALLMDPNPATTYPEATSREAARLIVERGVRVLPVVTGANDLVGLLTPAELLATLPPAAGHLATHLRRRFAPAYSGTPARVAVEILRSTRTTALPLLDDDGSYVGLLTDATLLAKARVRESSVPSRTGLVADGDAWAWEGLRESPTVRRAISELELPRATAGELADRKAPTVGLNASLRESIELVLRRGVHHLPVLDEEGRLVDLLGELDLLAAALEGRG